MFKNFVYNKTFKMISFLLILAIILIYPSSTKYDLSKTKSYKNDSIDIYMPNNDNYIAKTKVSINYNSYEDKIKNIVELLILEGKYSNMIPNKYKAVLPSGVKLLDIKLDNDNIILNFNSSFLETKEKDLEKNINLITYNCLNNEYNKLYIEIDSKLLTNFNDIVFNQPFTKESYLNVINNTKFYDKTINTKLYFHTKTYDLVPVTIINNSNKEKIEIIIEELSNSNYKGLYSLMNYNVKLINYEIKDDNMYLFFNESIYDNNKNKVILKPVYELIESSIIANYPIKNIKIYVNNKEIKKSSIKNVE